MAFGFLARARGAAPAAGATRPEPAAGNNLPSSNNNAAAPTGFAASAADRATETEDASDIPEPTGYTDLSAKVQVVAEDAGEQAEEPPTVVATPIAKPAVYSRPLVIGLPLAAAAILFTAYWLILRWGAM